MCFYLAIPLRLSAIYSTKVRRVIRSELGRKRRTVKMAQPQGQETAETRVAEPVPVATQILTADDTVCYDVPNVCDSLIIIHTDQRQRFCDRSKN